MTEKKRIKERYGKAVQRRNTMKTNTPTRNERVSQLFPGYPL